MPDNAQILQVGGLVLKRNTAQNIKTIDALAILAMEERLGDWEQRIWINSKGPYADALNWTYHR